MIVYILEKINNTGKMSIHFDLLRHLENVKLLKTLTTTLIRLFVLYDTWFNGRRYNISLAEMSKFRHLELVDSALQPKQGDLCDMRSRHFSHISRRKFWLKKTVYEIGVQFRLNRQFSRLTEILYTRSTQTFVIPLALIRMPHFYFIM